MDIQDESLVEGRESIDLFSFLLDSLAVGALAAPVWIWQGACIEQQLS